MDWDDEFASFVCTHSAALQRTAWVLTGEAEAAADLVQETLVHLYSKWDRVLASAAPLAYVRTTLVRQFLSQARKARWRELSVADVDDAHLDQADDQQRIEDRILLHGPLASLPPKHRAAIVLRYVYDLPAEQAASVMGCPVATFRSHLHRGMAELRRGFDVEPGISALDQEIP